MSLEYNWKYKDYELRAVPKGLVRFDRKTPNHTIELVKWYIMDDHKICISILYWVKTEESYRLKTVGNRMLDCIDLEDIGIIWEKLQDAQEYLIKNGG